jgi:hypothetical protein
VQLREGGAVDGGPLGDRVADHDLVGLAEGDPEDRVELLVLLDHPDHHLGLVADVLGGLGQVQQAPKRRRLEVGAGGAQHPELEVVLHLVQAVLEVADLGGKAAVAQYEGAVGQPDGGLGQVLHLDEHVDGPVEVGDGGVVLGVGRLPDRGGGQLPQAGDALRRPAQEQHVAGDEHGVAVDVGVPLAAAAHRHHPHAGLHGQFQRRQGPVRHVRALADQDPVRHLLGVGQVGDELCGNAQPVRDDSGDVDGVVAHPLDGGHHLEHRRHALGVTGAAGRQHAHGTHVVHQFAHLLLELEHLLGHVGIAEVDRGVGQVHHQFRGVLGLGQHGPQVAGSVVHQFLARGRGSMVGPAQRRLGGNRVIRPPPPRPWRGPA